MTVDRAAAFAAVSLLLRKLDIRRVFLAGNVLHHGLAALHDLGVGIVGIGWRAVQFPALVERKRDLVAEGGVVRGCRNR